jgi:response regulator RpfG family c-di-GMP phosphodiesterase
MPGHAEPSDRGQVLVVDDDPLIREVVQELFREAGYDCEVAPDGRQGFAAFRAWRPSLVVTDLRMPGLDGLGLLKAAREIDPEVAVVVLTGADDVKTAITCLKLGAHDFITKPVEMEWLLVVAERALERRQLLRERRQYQELLEQRVAEATRELDAAYRQLRETYRVTLEALGSALDTRDVGTEAHSRRVHDYALATARAHGLPEERLADLSHGVLLHDIGKIGIPDAILLKPGPLTPEEWTIMRRHAGIGKRLIENIPFLAGAVPIVFHHHERWDGTGYPLGLRGEDIPLGARIFSIVDAFDAMTFDRPYSRAIPVAPASARGPGGPAAVPGAPGASAMIARGGTPCTGSASSEWA